MNRNNQIDDHTATLSLAYQIGMNSSCIPSLNLPSTQQKYKIAHWKLAMKYFQSKDNKNNKNCYGLPFNNSKQNNQNKSERRPATTPQNKRIRNYSTHRQLAKSWYDEDPRAQTARTSYNRRTNRFNSTFQSKFTKTQPKFRIKSKTDKNLLALLWNPQDHFKNKSQMLLSKNGAGSQKKQRSNQKNNKKGSARIQYNMDIKSFEFC